MRQGYFNRVSKLTPFHHNRHRGTQGSVNLSLCASATATMNASYKRMKRAVIITLILRTREATKPHLHRLAYANRHADLTIQNLL